MFNNNYNYEWVETKIKTGGVKIVLKRTRVKKLNK